MSAPRVELVDAAVSAENDRLARAHAIDDYYARSPLPLRAIEARRLEIIRRMVGEDKGTDLLDVGAGGGHVAALFPEARRTLLDVSEEYLRTARARVGGDPRVRFVHAELDRAGFEDASFDRIVCTEVIEHVVDPSALLAEIARLLRPRGVAVVTAPNDPLILRMKGLVRRTPLGWAIGDRVEWGGDRYHLHRWTPGAFRRFVERSLDVVEVDAAPHRALPVRVVLRCRKRPR